MSKPAHRYVGQSATPELSGVSLHGTINDYVA